MLLQHANEVSLYLSSGQISFAPRLLGDSIEVETTLLAPELISNPLKSEGFIKRHIDTFISAMDDRFSYYASDVSRDFDVKKDIAFIVNAGSSHEPVGRWLGGNWIKDEPVKDIVSAANGQAQPITSKGNGREEKKSKEIVVSKNKKNCNCSARQ